MSSSKKTTQLPYLAAANIADDDVLHIVDVSAARSKQVTVADLISLVTAGVGTGTVTSVSVVTANGVSGTVANPTTTPAITLTLGAITPSSVNSVVLSGASTPTLLVTGATQVSGVNTGNQIFTASGDATAPGSTSNLALTLASVVTAGSVGSATNVPIITYDAKGRITGTTSATVIAAAGTLTGTTLASNVTNSSLQTLGTITTGVWTGTPIAVLNGGTGATTAAGARSNLGLVIGTNVFTQRTITGTANEITVANGDGVSANPTISIPTAVTFTGKTVTGGTYSGPTISGTVTDSGTTTKTGTLNATGATFSVNKIANLTGNGFVKTSGGDGTLSVDTSTYITANQTITLSGDVTGSGSTAITTTLATVNSNIGAFGSSTSIPSFTVNAKGLVTAAGSNVVIAPAGTLTGTTLASNVVTSSLTSVGTIGTGVWQGTILGNTYGGTGANLSATGGAGQVLRQSSTGAVVTVSQLAASDLSNGTTGSGAVVLATSPTLVTPVLGVATATSVNGLTITTTTGTLTILSGKTGTINNNLTFNGTDGSAVQFSGGGTVAYILDKLSVFAPTTSLEFNSVISDNTGSGLVVFNDTPTILTPTVTAPTIAGGTHIAITSFGLRSTGASFDLKFASTETLTANRTVTVVTGDADRTLTFTGNATISNVNSGDQLYTASGDATAPSSASTLVLTLATVNSNIGAFGGSTAIPTVTVNGKGLVTAVSTNAVVAPAGTLTGTTLASNVVSSSLTSVGTIISGVWTGTTIAVANGGTGATTASGARTNLGLVIGTDVQAWDTQLDSIASLSYGSSSLKAIRVNAGETGFELYTPAVGTVTTVSVVTANGVSGSVSNPTTTPAITLTLGAITPTTIVASGNITGLNLLGTNSGDQSFTASGDATAPGSTSTLVLTLATVNSNVGTFGALASGGQPTLSPIVTVNGKGLVTAVSHAAVIADATTLIGTHLPSNVVGSSLQSVDVISSGAWRATIVGNQWGGTGANLSATGGTSQVLKQTSTGAAVTVGQLVASDLSNGTSGSGAVVLAGAPTLTSATLNTAFMDAIYSTGSSLLMRAGTANTSTVDFQAWNGTAYEYLFFIESLPGSGTVYGDLSTKVTIGGNTIYSKFQGSNTGVSVRVDDGGTGRLSATAYAVICGGTTSTAAHQSVSGVGTSGQVLTSNGASALPTWQNSAASGGTVTSVSVVTANGVSGSVANSTTTPAITITLGDITPTTVTSTGKIRAGTGADGVLAVWDNANSREITLTAGNTVLTLGGTGSPSLSLASNLLLPLGGEINWNGGDVKLTQSADLLTLSGGNLSLAGNNVTSGNWLASTILVAVGGSGRVSATAYAPICGGTTTTGAHQSTTNGNSGEVFISQGSSALPTWSTFAALMNTWKGTVFGYDSTRRQILTHDSTGAWAWKNVNTGC